MLNRTIQPEISNHFRIAKPEIRKNELIQSLFRYSIHNPAEDLFKLELVFATGTLYQQIATQASLSFGLITEGTHKMSASEISGKFDYYGCFLQKNTGREFSSITLFCLNKYADVVIPFLREIIEDAAYPQNDFDIERKNKKKSLEVQLKNTDVVSELKLFENLFSQNSPLSKYARVEDYDYIERKNVQDFHNNQIKKSLSLILLSGNCTSKIEKIVDENFVSLFDSTTSNKSIELEFNNLQSPIIFTPMSDSVQCSISAGLPLFNIVHPSYKKFMLLNTVFGAYFGSRLMSNLREKNGFTYGASSMIQTFNKGGILIINTDVGKEVAYQAIEEIKNEINKIRNEKIGDEELQKVKNYFGGSISRGFDSVFSVADKIKRLAKHNLTLDFYDEMLEETKHTNAEDLLQLAQNHLSVDKLVISIAGAMDQLS